MAQRSLFGGQLTYGCRLCPPITKNRLRATGESFILFVSARPLSLDIKKETLGLAVENKIKESDEQRSDLFFHGGYNYKFIICGFNIRHG